MCGKSIIYIFILFFVQGCVGNDVVVKNTPEITPIPTSIPLSTNLLTAEITPTPQLLYPELIDRCADMKIVDFEDFSFAKNTRAIYQSINEEGELEGYFLLSVDDQEHPKTEDLDVLNDIEVYFSDLAISPDGQKILYTILDEKFNYHIKILNLEDQSLLSEITIKEKPNWRGAHAYWVSENEILIIESFLVEYRGKIIITNKAFLMDIFSNEKSNNIDLSDERTTIFPNQLSYYLSDYSIIYGNQNAENDGKYPGFYYYDRNANQYSNIFDWTTDSNVSLENANTLNFEYMINLTDDQIIDFFFTTNYGFEAVINTEWSVVENLNSPTSEIYFPFPYDPVTENRIDVFDFKQGLVGLYHFPNGYLGNNSDEEIINYSYYFYDWGENLIFDYCLTSYAISSLPFSQIHSGRYFSWWNEELGVSFILNLISGEMTKVDGIIMSWINTK